jgi:hypothetical protein
MCMTKEAGIMWKMDLTRKADLAQMRGLDDYWYNILDERKIRVLQMNRMAV